MSDSAAKDQRQFLRRAARIAVEMWLQSEMDEAPLIEAVTTDLSTGGIAIRGRAAQVDLVDASVAVNAPVATRFSLPSHAQPIRAVARPRWLYQREEPGMFDMGLQFEEITSTNRDAIVAFILRDLGLQKGQADVPLVDKIQGIDDIATRIEQKMREIDNLLASVVAGRAVLIEEVTSLRQILLRLYQGK